MSYLWYVIVRNYDVYVKRQWLTIELQHLTITTLNVYEDRTCFYTLDPYDLILRFWASLSGNSIHIEEYERIFASSPEQQSVIN